MCPEDGRHGEFLAGIYEARQATLVGYGQPQILILLESQTHAHRAERCRTAPHRQLRAQRQLAHSELERDPRPHISSAG